MKDAAEPSSAPAQNTGMMRGPRGVSGAHIGIMEELTAQSTTLPDADTAGIQYSNVYLIHLHI